MRHEGRAIGIGGAKQRALLAVLTLHANEVVSIDRLVHEVWGDQPSPNAPKTVHVYVSGLRKALGDGVLVTRAPGYVLVIEHAGLDSRRFESLLHDSRHADAARKSALLDEALSLWRGPALADFAYEPFAQAEIGRLEELRLTAVEERIDAVLAQGHHADVVGDLESLVASHPLRERLRGQLMLALYRGGRQVEALEAYRAARRSLVDELGIDPSKALQELEQAILRHDPSLDAAAPRPDPGSVRVGPTGTVTFVSIDIEGSTRIVQELRDAYGDVLDAFRGTVRAAIRASGGHEVDTQGDAFLLAFTTARNAVTAAIAVQGALAREPLPHDASLRARIGIHSGAPGVGAEGYHGVDVVRVSRICAAGHGGQILLSSATRELVEGELPADAVMRELGDFTLKDLQRPERIYQLDWDPRSREFPPLRNAIPLPRGGRGVRRFVPPGLRARDRILLGLGIALVATGGAAGTWVLSRGPSARAPLAVPNSLAAIEIGSDRIAADIPVGNTPTKVAVGVGSVWVLNSNEQTLSRIDPAKRAVLRVLPAGGRSSDVAVGAGAVWVAGSEQTLTRIDPDAPLAAGARPLSLPGVQNPLLSSAQPSRVAATADAVWATTTGAVWRIEPNPRRRSVLAVSGCCGPVAIGLGSVWVGSQFAVDRLDLETGRLQARIKLPFTATDIVVGESGVWLTDEASDRLWHIDPRLNAVTTTITVGQGPSGVAVGAGAVWVASADGTVSQVDPGADRVIRTLDVGGTPSGIAVGEGTVWVTVD